MSPPRLQSAATREGACATTKASEHVYWRNPSGSCSGRSSRRGDLRESYVKANLVCRIQSTGTDIWFHLSFLNFSTRRGTMLRLQPIVDGPRHMLAAASGRIALTADMPELRLDTLWDLFDDPNLATVWGCEFLELASTDRVVDDGFLPGDVLAEAMQPPQCCVFWRPGVRAAGRAPAVIAHFCCRCAPSQDTTRLRRGVSRQWERQRRGSWCDRHRLRPARNRRHGGP